MAIELELKKNTLMIENYSRMNGRKDYYFLIEQLSDPSCISVVEKLDFEMTFQISFY